MVRLLFSFEGELMVLVITPVFDILFKTFSVWCTFGAVTRDNHLSQLGVVTALNWKSMTC